DPAGRLDPAGLPHRAAAPPTLPARVGPAARADPARPVPAGPARRSRRTAPAALRLTTASYRTGRYTPPTRRQGSRRPAPPRSSRHSVGETATSTVTTSRSRYAVPAVDRRVGVATGVGARASRATGPGAAAAAAAAGPAAAVAGLRVDALAQPGGGHVAVDPIVAVRRGVGVAAAVDGV